MNNAYDELQDLDAQLMLYVAGELSPTDARALERELAGDAALQARLAGLRELTGFCDTQLGIADAADPLAPERVAQSAHRAKRAIRGWTDSAVAGRITPQPSPLENAVWRFARWPLTAAAVLVVGIIVWTFASDPHQRIGPTEVTQSDGWDANADGMGRGRGFGWIDEPRSLTFLGPDRIDGINAPGWNTPTPEQVAAIFDTPAGQWGTDEEGSLIRLDLGSGFLEDLAAVQMLAGDLSGEGPEQEALDALWLDAASGL